MSVHYSSIVWKMKFPDPTRKLVALSLADQANDEGSCYPSVLTIANRCNVSQDTARRHLRELERTGFMHVQDRFKEGKQTSNVYQLTPCADASPTPGADARPPLAPTPAPPLHGCKAESSIEPSKEPKGLLDVPPSDLPPELQTPEIMDLWERFKLHRKQKRSAMTPEAARMGIAKLKIMGPVKAALSLKQSIENNWTGIFEPKNHEHQNNSKSPSRNAGTHNTGRAADYGKAMHTAGGKTGGNETPNR